MRLSEAVCCEQAAFFVSFFALIVFSCLFYLHLLTWACFFCIIIVTVNDNWQYGLIFRIERNIIMSIFQEISEKLQKGRAKDVSALVEQALNDGIAPQDILNEAMVVGMNAIGEKFRTGEIYVPEVLIAARAMNAGLKVLKPALTSAGVEPIGKAVICTVKGDMHDIGKNLVKMMIEGKGIECIDLGVNVEPSAVVNAVKESGATVVCLSALLTTTMNGQKDVIDALIEAGIRDSVKVMIGGAPVTQSFADEIGADAYTMDAASAAEVARSFMLN